MKGYRTYLVLAAMAALAVMEAESGAPWQQVAYHALTAAALAFLRAAIGAPKQDPPGGAS